MATPISMKNSVTGETKIAYYGFSWTTFFFWFIPPLFRSDWLAALGAFLVWFILSAMTGVGGAIAMFIWAFMYNRHHTMKLIKDGFQFNGTHEENKLAAMQLKIELTKTNCTTFIVIPDASEK